MRFLLIAYLMMGYLSITQAQDKIQLLWRSENLLAEKDTAKAIRGFEEVLKQYPQSYTACLRLAEIYNDQKDYHKAIQYCNIVIDITDDYIINAQHELDKNGHLLFDDELKDRQNKLKVYKLNQGDAHHLKGLIRVKQDRWEDAQSEFGKALILSPQDPDIKIDYALLKMDLGQLKDARQLIDKAIKDDTVSVKPYFNLANLHYKVGQYDSAFLLYDKVIGLKPEFRWPYLYQGHIYAQEEQYEQALQSYSTYLTLDSTSEEVYYRRAVILVELGKWEDALMDWNKVIEINSSNHEAWRSRGLTYFQLKDYTKAITDFDEALKLAPNQTYTIVNRGYSHYLNNDSKSALKDLNIGVDAMPNYYYGFYFRALVHLQLKNKKLACSDLKKALTLGMKETEVDKFLLKKCKR